MNEDSFKVPVNEQVSIFDDAKRLLETLFGEAEGSVLLRFIKGDHVITRFARLADINWGEVERLNREEQYDVFFGVCRRREGLATKEGVTEVTCLWADLDAEDFPGGKAEAWRQIWSLPGELKPSAVVDSGHGYHVYWRLYQPVRIVGEEDIARIESYVAGLAKLLGGDAVQDLSRLLRLPGTTNWKYHDHPVECHVDYLDCRRRFDLCHFDPYRVDIKQPSRTQTIEITEVPPIPVSKLRVRRTIRELILHPPEEGERSEAAWAVMQALIEAGYTASEIYAVIKANPIGRRYYE